MSDGHDDIPKIGVGFHFEDLHQGMRFRTASRTLTEADLVNFCNMTWLTEELFTNTAHRGEMALTERVVPGALVYSFCEGLMLPMMQDTGLAFLHMELDVKAPTRVGDTITVFCEVIEHRLTSRGDRGLVRTRNSVRDQDGREVLVYTPLRLIKRRAQGQAQD